MDRKIVLVTGASSGIGEATARLLARRRHTVLLSGRNGQRLKGLERELASQGLRVVALPADLTRDEEARALVVESLKTFGAVDALFHAAGVFHVGRLEETSADEFRRVLDTNLTALHNLLRHLLPHFYGRQRGHVVAVGSVAARRAWPLETAYCASKFALVGLLEALRAEGREKGLKVTLLHPGPTATPIWRAYPGKAPLERMLKADTVAEAAVFLLEQPPEALPEELTLAPAEDPFKVRRP